MTKKESQRITLALRTAANLTAEHVKATRLLVMAEVNGHFFCTGTPKSGPLVFTVAAKTAELFLEQVAEFKSNE
jgi:hypothetical protein